MARKPPAFQCYAANLIADRNYKLMTLAERGLFVSMYLESWVNSKLPANYKDLAKYLGFEEDYLKENLSERVLNFFKKDGQDYICPELEDYRNILIERNLAKANGGKKGAELKKQKKANDELVHKGTPSGNEEGTPSGSLDKNKLIKNNSNSSTGSEVFHTQHQSWIEEYSNTSDAYLRASRG